MLVTEIFIERSFYALFIISNFLFITLMLWYLHISIMDGSIVVYFLASMTVRAKKEEI